MARKISLLLITVAAFILFPFAVSANEPMSFSTEDFEFNNVNFEIVSGANGATLVLFGEYKNTRNIDREPHWEIESSLVLSQGTRLEIAKELEVTEEYDFDKKLAENLKKELGVGEKVNIAIGYELIDDSSLFIQNAGSFFEDDGLEFSHEIQLSEYDKNSILEPKTLEEKAQEISEEVFEEELIRVAVLEDKHITIESQIYDNFSNEWIRSGFESLVAETLREIQDYEYQTVSVIGYFDMVDQYGNLENDEVFLITFQKSEIDKINFENFNEENLKNIAINYHWHPAFME